MKNPKHLTFAALALVAALVSIGAVAFSQGSYPPPTGLTAATQSVDSGQIRLAWVKPSSNDVIGYNIYRDNVYLDYVIGGGTLSYYDNSLPPSISYDYFVKAVYLGVAEADLPASNTVSAVSPAYCTGTCVNLNPFLAGPGRTIVDLQGTKLDDDHKKSKIFIVNLPAGRYQVYVRSFDAYQNRAYDSQNNERWFLSLLSSGQEIAKTNPTVDLSDGSDEVGSTQVIETELVLSESVNQIRAVHVGVNGGSFDDVGTSAVMFVDMDAANPGCLLVIDKTSDKTGVAPGDLLTYTITIANEGTENCTGGGNYMFDKLSSDVIFVSETHNGSMHIKEAEAYYPDGHYVWLVATTPLVPGEVAIATITVRVKNDIPAVSCDGDTNGDTNIVNQVYVTNNQYGDRSIKVYSNSVATLCDADPKPQIDTTVVPSPNPSYPDRIVTWTATPFGACPGPFSYSWTGDDALSGSTRTVTHTYESLGNYFATVTVSAPNCLPVTRQAPVPLVVTTQPAPDSITCAGSPRNPKINDTVTWTANATPAGDYTYSWSGDDSLSGSTQTITKKYQTAGVKNATVSLVGTSGPSTCSGTIRVRENPNYQEI